jgi:hypothetical protein
MIIGELVSISTDRMTADMLWFPFGLGSYAAAGLDFSPPNVDLDFYADGSPTPETYLARTAKHLRTFPMTHSISAPVDEAWSNVASSIRYPFDAYALHVAFAARRGNESVPIYAATLAGNLQVRPVRRVGAELTSGRTGAWRARCRALTLRVDASDAFGQDAPMVYDGVDFTDPGGRVLELELRRAQAVVRKHRAELRGFTL